MTIAVTLPEKQLLNQLRDKLEKLTEYGLNPSVVSEAKLLFKNTWNALHSVHNRNSYCYLDTSEDTQYLYMVAQEIVNFGLQNNREIKQDNDSIGPGLVWQILMPNVRNNQTIGCEPLKNYYYRHLMILTDDGFLVTLEELEMSGKDYTTGKEHHNALRHPHNSNNKTNFLSDNEKAQVKLKFPALYLRHYVKTWISQITYEKLAFALNIAVSASSHPDLIADLSNYNNAKETFAMRFTEGLLANSEFRKGYYQYLEKHGDALAIMDTNDRSGDYSAEALLKISYCFFYIINHVKTLPKEEQEAFEYLRVRDDSDSFHEIISKFYNKVCAARLARQLTDSLVYLTGKNNKGKLKFKAKRKYSEASDSEKGAKENLVKPSSWKDRFKSINFSWKKIAFASLLSLGTYPVLSIAEKVIRKTLSLTLGTLRKGVRPLLVLMLIELTKSKEYLTDTFAIYRGNYRLGKYFGVGLILLIPSLFVFAVWCLHEAEDLILKLFSPYNTYLEMRFAILRRLLLIEKEFRDDCTEGYYTYTFFKHAAPVLLTLAFLSLILFATPMVSELVGSILSSSNTAYLTDFLANLSSIPVIGQIFYPLGQLLSLNVIMPALNFLGVFVSSEWATAVMTFFSIVATSKLAKAACDAFSDCCSANKDIKQTKAKKIKQDSDYGKVTDELKTSNNRKTQDISNDKNPIHSQLYSNAPSGKGNILGAPRVSPSSYDFSPS